MNANGIVFIVFLVWLAGVYMGAWAVAIDKDRTWSGLCIKHGAAVWQVDENGNETFAWKDNE